ncbi:MAG: L-threonylcarbamoyladenylate synthase [Treponema sp.]|nr:L-threonylcarbamoyladenylate synthase [Treponema sp.]
MEILNDSRESLEKAAALLKRGGLAAFPTETVYGLGADAFNPLALARVFEVKNRPRFDPLIIHIAHLDALPRVADLKLLEGAAAERLAILSQALWPGPLTLILPKHRDLPDLATAGLPHAAVRFPSHPSAQALIRLSTGALAAPSANPFGFLSPTRAEHVAAQLGDRVDLIIDGGRCPVGLESTVLDISGTIPRILRPGGISAETLGALIGKVELSLGSDGLPQSPGQEKGHYSPRTPLEFCEGDLSLLPPEKQEGRLYFKKPREGDQPPHRILSARGDLGEAAANLFDMLHELDGMGLDLIRAEAAPNQGLGLAINDRLRRAAFRGEERS